MSAVYPQPAQHQSGRTPDERVAPQGISPDLERQPPVGRVEDERFGAALANVPSGLCMFDADKRLIVSNARYGEMYNLPPDFLVPGTSLAKIIAYRQAIGNAPADFPSYATHDGIDF